MKRVNTQSNFGNPLMNVPVRPSKSNTDNFINESNLNYKINSAVINPIKRKKYVRSETAHTITSPITNNTNTINTNNNNLDNDHSLKEKNMPYKPIVKIHRHKNQYKVDKSIIL